jgi:uncharacterized protein involved in exopolysaccharide biosynthesis
MKRFDLTLMARSAVEQEVPLLEELGVAIARHKLLIGVVLALTAMSTYVGMQLVTEQYESVARLLVRLGRENTQVPMTVEKGGVLSTGVRKEEINSEVQLLQSRDLIETTIDEIGTAAFQFRPSAPHTLLENVKYQAKRLARSVREGVHELLVLVNLRRRLSDREKAIVLIESSLKVEREKDSDVISARLRLPDPDLAVRFLDRLVANYLTRHVDVRREPSVSAFYEAQVDTYRRRLGDIGSARQAVRTERGAVSVADQRALLLRRLRTLQDDIEDLSHEQRIIGGERAQPTTAAANPDARATRELGAYATPDLLKRRLTELRIKRNETLQRYKGETPVVRDIDAEIADVEGLMLAGLESKLRGKRAEARSLQAELGQLDAGEKELDSVDEERQAAIQNFLVYSKRLEEARISSELDRQRVSNISILSAPERPIEPAYPKKVLFVGVAIPFGLVLGTALALLLEYLNRTIRSARDLRAMGNVPLLGVLRLPADGGTGRLVGRELQLPDGLRGDDGS